MCITELREKQSPFFVTVPYIYSTKQSDDSPYKVQCYLTNAL